MAKNPAICLEQAKSPAPMLVFLFERALPPLHRCVMAEMCSRSSAGTCIAHLGPSMCNSESKDKVKDITRPGLSQVCRVRSTVVPQSRVIFHVGQRHTIRFSVRDNLTL